MSLYRPLYRLKCVQNSLVWDCYGFELNTLLRCMPIIFNKWQHVWPTRSGDSNNCLVYEPHTISEPFSLSRIISAYKAALSCINGCVGLIGSIISLVISSLCLPRKFSITAAHVFREKSLFFPSIWCCWSTKYDSIDYHGVKKVSVSVISCLRYRPSHIVNDVWEMIFWSGIDSGIYYSSAHRI